MGCGGTERVRRSKKRLESATSPSRQREIASSPIPNYIFSGEGVVPGLPPKVVRTTLVEGLRYVRFFVYAQYVFIV